MTVATYSFWRNNSLLCFKFCKNVELYLCSKVRNDLMFTLLSLLTALCLTPTCITVASMLINSMDTSVDPCTDFYSYACGGWIDKHVIPSGHARWSTFGELWKSNQEVMKRVIGEKT